MKRKIKKFLRLLLVFLYSFALVCFCLPAKATAQEFTFNGNSSSSMNLKANAYNFFIDKLKELYDSLGSTEDWANFCEEHGVDILTQTINYNNNFILDTMAAELSAVTGIPEPFLHLSTELSNIDDIYQNTSNYSARGKKNFDDFSKFYKYANMRGGLDNIEGSSVSGDFFIPESIDFYCNVYFGDDTLGANVTNTRNISQILGSEDISYSSIPFVSGTIHYNNGSFSYSATNEGFEGVQSDMYRFVFTVSGGHNGQILAISGDSVRNVAPISGCDVSSGLVITKNNSDSSIQFIVYTDSPYSGNFKIHWNDYTEGGMTAPRFPTFQYPEKENNPYFEREVQEYNYYTALTQQILDDYDVSQLYNDLYNSFDGSSWLTFPLEVWRDFGDLLLDGYSSTFHFHIDRIDLDFIEFGFNFPECDFEFDPYDYIGGASDLQNAMGVLFVTFQHIIAFGYIYALFVWGRSLILRIGSDTLHRDYEDN